MTTAAESAEGRFRLSSWELEELLSSPDDLVASLADLEDRVRQFETYRERLGSLARDQVVELVRAYESILTEASKLAAYSSLWFASDTQSDAALNFRNRVQQSLTHLHNRTLFFGLWWKGLEDDRAAELLPNPESEPAAEDYAFYLEDLRRFRVHTLDEGSERIINVKDADGIDAVLTLYSMITNRFEFRIEGEESPITRDRLMSYAYSPVPERRKAAYQELHRVYGEHAPVLAQMYIHRVRDWHNENVELRGYQNAIAVRNVANNISDEAVTTLLDVVRSNATLFQRYFRVKASWLGEERLRRYDVYAPLSTSDERVEYGEAVELVLDTFERFDPEFGELAGRIFEERHIDSETRAGKKGGAFCATVLPNLTPWVLVNFTGRLRDVATLAHELGHAVHSLLASEHSILTQQPSLPLAETASVFAEMLMTEHLLSREQDPLLRRELIASALDDIYATVMRQAFFVRFEVAAHQAILDNRSAEELHEMYLANLLEQFGDSLDIAPEFRHEWLCIPHIYSTPFYCYAYSFGQLLVLALYRRYQDEGERFKPVYRRLLASGGARRPSELLEEAGVDPADPVFWQGGFGLVEDWIAELEADSATPR